MPTKTSSFMGPLTALGALVAAMAALLIAYNASPAHAAGSCSTTAGTTTCTFSPTGAEDTFLVPDGVSSVHVVATGAAGAVGFGGGSAGRGAEVSGDLTVTPGQTLYVNVGGAPTEVIGTCRPGIACIGGFNGGGSSTFGGGGGGASDVRTVSRDQDGSLASRLIVAGGGGGSGLQAPCSVGGILLGGAGGDAGSDGGAGPSCGSLAGGTGGKAGTESAGGLGGSPFGENGSLGLGGGGGSNTGGGGGGGLYGGGGGGNLTFRFSTDPPVNLLAPSGGGGGGSNLVPAGGNAVIADGSPSVTISYSVSDTTPPTVTDTSLTATTPQGTASKTTNVTATFSEPVQNVSTETFILERKIAVKKAPPKFVLVDATVSLSADGSYVLDPVQDLPKGDYRATITTEVTDLANPANALDQDSTQAGNQPKVWTFKVEK